MSANLPVIDVTTLQPSTTSRQPIGGDDVTTLIHCSSSSNNNNNNNDISNSSSRASIESGPTKIVSPISSPSPPSTILGHAHLGVTPGGGVRESKEDVLEEKVEVVKEAIIARKTSPRWHIPCHINNKYMVHVDQHTTDEGVANDWSLMAELEIDR